MAIHEFTNIEYGIPSTVATTRIEEAIAYAKFARAALRQESCAMIHDTLAFLMAA